MTTSFWQMLDEVLDHSHTETGATLTRTGEEIAKAFMAHKEWNTGELTGFDIERELRGSFAQYSNWAITNMGDHWAFIKR